MSLVYNRYAVAFFNLSLQENATNEYQNDLVAVTAIYKSENKFRDFLLNPKNNISYKKQILTNVFEGKIGTNTLNFLMLLLDKNRLKYLQEICTEFVRISDKEQNILSITIITAIPLEQKYIKIVSEKYKKLFQASNVKVTLEIDSTLIGGIKVAVGDKLFDASVKEKLSGLRSAMTL